MPSPEHPPGNQQRALVRKQLRLRRRAVPRRIRREAAASLARRIPRIMAYSRARWIAAYLPFDGEIDLRPLIQAGVKAGKRFCLPMIDRRHPGTMSLGHLSHRTILLPNRWGILEPHRRSTRRIPLQRIDVILVPLVAFDLSGNRLGMGAGYYDRLLQHRSVRGWRRPVLIGVAFETQKMEQLFAESWDVALDWVVTEKQIYRMPAKSNQTD
jgi:5-formyltetrahydrofolate cyclo-ligase